MKTQEWHNVYITDKSGKKMWNTITSPLSTIPEINNLKRQLKAAKEHPDLYKFLDLNTAVIMVDGEIYDESVIEDTDVELLKLLGIT